MRAAEVRRREQDEPLWCVIGVRHQAARELAQRGPRGYVRVDFGRGFARLRHVRTLFAGRARGISL
jgi:hypothetical protein